MKKYRVIGPPGTGKTRSLLHTVQKCIDEGISLKDIGYFAFTRKAANEARDRFLADNVGLTKKDIPYFQTLHSFAFNQLGLKEENVMQEEHYKKIGDTCGIQIEYAKHETNQWNGIFSSDSEYLTLINLAKVRQITPLEQFDKNEHLTWVERFKLDAIAKEIESYKKTYGLIDFNDMIEKFLKAGRLKTFKTIIVDEAQDLSKLQWDMLHKIIKDSDELSPKVWIAGDDDQAIFGWAGADIKSFQSWKGIDVLLTKSRRVPITIQTKALDVISRVGVNRIQKDYLPREEQGEIIERFKLSDVITDMEKGDWLILTRTNSLLKPVLPQLKRHGLFFETAQGNSIGKSLYEDIGYWNQMRDEKEIPDVQKQRVLERMQEVDLTLPWQKAFTKVSPTQLEYMDAMLANGEDLTQTPRIKVSTIHGAKGGEATNVVLYLNQTINTMAGAKKSLEKQDEEYRVWYVGITRCAKNLYLIKSNNKSKEFKI
jgi:DNA helicase-2/ATP-dependent DNA helicase PcrA